MGDKLPKRLVRPYDLAAIYREHYEFVFKFCYRNTFSVADAEDLTHDVFVIAFHEMKSLEVIENFWSWIFVIAKYRIFRFWKKRRNDISIDELHEADEWQLRSGETSLEVKIALAEAWGALATVQKRAFFLTKVCGYSSQEAGDMIGAADSTVRTQLGDAVHQMRRHIPTYARYAYQI